MNDYLPPLPEPDGTAEVNKEPYLDGYSCEYAPAWSESLVRAYASAAVLAERERCADICDGVAAVCADSSKGARKEAAIAAAKSCERLIRGETV